MERKSKMVFQLDSPFTSAVWPEASPQNQDTILELLYSLLSPIGKHRTNHVTPSKGKRSKKRKRMETKSKVEGLQISSPPPPEISGSIVVGLNNITRSLESLSKSSKPPNAPYPPDGERESLVDDARHFSAVFVLRSSQPPILHSHLPQLIATASLAHPNLPATRLVQLSNGCDARLCEALGLPRVSFIGILEGAPHSKSLVDLVQKCVPEIQIPWIQEVTASKYLPVKINAIQTFAPVTKSESQAT